MSPASNARPDCSFCGGNGLPILPVRYAVARDDAPSTDAPVLPEDLKDDTVSRITLPDGQHYTLRLLREGFFYLFNEVRGRWQGYYVTPGGFLSLYIDVAQDELAELNPDEPGDLDADINGPIEDDEFPCLNNPEHVYPGRCVTVPAAQEADTIYMTFSDDRWTKRVWKEYATNQNGRRDTMRQLSLQQWKSGSAEHARPLNELDELLAEAAFPQTAHNTESEGATTTTEVHALTHSLAPVNGMQGDVENFVNWARRQAGDIPPAMLVLDDPAGVTSDLASLLEVREKEFNEREEIKRPFVTASMINALREGYRERGRQQRADEIIENRLEAEYYQTFDSSRDPLSAREGRKAYFEQQQAKNPAYRQEVDNFRKATLRGISEAELDEAADDAWDKYGDKLRDVVAPENSEANPENAEAQLANLDQKAYQRWMEKDYREALTEYDSTTMTPLAQAYLNWLTGGALLTYLNTRFDDCHIESGITFASVISSVVLATQSYTPAFTQCMTWLSSTEITHDNLLLRGLSLNQQSLIEEIMVASDGNFGEEGHSPLELPWGPLIAAYLGLTADYPDAVASLPILIGRVLGPIQSAVSATQLPKPLLATLGMATGRPVRVNQLHTTVEAALPRLRAPLQLVNSDWGDSELRQFQKKVRLETRSLIPTGTLSSGGASASFDVREISLGALDDLFDDPELLSLSNRFQLEISASIVGAFLAAFSIQNHLKGMDSLLDAGVRSQTRLLGMSIALFSSAVELVGKTLEQNLTVFQRGNHLAKGALRLGARLGLAGGIILGAMDVWEGFDEFGENKPVMGSLYVLSGFSTIGASTAIFFAGVGAAAKMAGSTALLARLAVALWWTGGILGVIAIAATVAIWWFSEDELQEWLAECAFGERGVAGPGNVRLEAELERLEAITHKEE